MLFWIIMLIIIIAACGDDLVRFFSGMVKAIRGSGRRKELPSGSSDARVRALLPESEGDTEAEQAESMIEDLKIEIRVAKAAIRARPSMGAAQAHVEEAEGCLKKARDRFRREKWSEAAAIAEEGIFAARLAKSTAENLDLVPREEPGSESSDEEEAVAEKNSMRS